MDTLIPPLRQEIILGSDGLFIKRETRESVITRADTAITQCTREDALCMSNIPTVINVEGHPHLMYVSHNQGFNPEYAYATVHMPLGFPLPGMYLQDIPDRGLCLRPSSRMREDDHPSFRVNDFYYFNNDYDIYVQTKHQVSGIGTHHAKLRRNNHTMNTWLFAICNNDNKINKIGDVITFNLPNIYDDGRICGGEDHRVEDLRASSQPIYNIYRYTAELVSTLYTSPCNADLYTQDLGDRHVGIECGTNGQHMTLSTTAMCLKDPNYVPSPAFFKTITNSNILDFVSCLTSTQN